MSHGDPTKWHQPGWRIEQKYAPGVLIGNWAEEQKTFQKGSQKSNSTYRVDFLKYGGYRPDVMLRRKAMLQNDGLGKEFLFYHHGNRYSNNMVSWYDEHYNKRERDGPNKLPDLRHWNSHQLAWIPEKTDYPIQGRPTNYGLHQKQSAQWSEQIADETHGDYGTTYSTSYNGIPRSAMVVNRYGTPKQMSTSLLRLNSVNKDLHFRGKPNLQSPECLPCGTA